MLVERPEKQCWAAWVWALLWILAAAAGSRPAAAQENGGGEDGPALQEDDEHKFTYVDGDRRDPFTFLRLEKEVVTVDPRIKINPGTVIGEKTRALKEAANRIKARAERALMDAHPNRAVSFCDQGLETLNKADVKLSDAPELQDLHEALFRLRLAAERLFNRQKAEADFKNLNLNVSGVVAKARNSQAIVNGKVVGRGDLLETGQGEGLVIVDEIQAGRVIVRYRGFRMELVVSN